MPTGQKHLIACRCVLSQFKQLSSPPRHQFIVFSIIDDDDKVKIKFAQCNNCGLIHKVTDICKSEIIHTKESMTSLITVDDIKMSLPTNLVMILESNNADLPTWEATQFFYEQKNWGMFIVLSTDVDSDLRQGKYVRLLGENLFKVEPYTREEVIS